MTVHRPLPVTPPRPRRAADGLEQHRVLAVRLGEQDPDDLLLRGRQVLAHVVGADRKLAVPPVDQDGELDGARASEVVERVKCRPHRPAGVQHVVDEHHGLAVDAVGGHLGAAQRPRRAQPQVIPVHRDVEGAVRHLLALYLGDPGSQPARQRDAAGRDAKQHDLLRSPGPLDDLVCDPGQRPADFGLLKDRFGICRAGDGTAVRLCGAGDTVRPASGSDPGHRRCRASPGGVRDMRHKDLLSRLTGRAFKGRQFCHTVPATAEPATERHGMRVIRAATAPSGRPSAGRAGSGVTVCDTRHHSIVPG